MFIIAHRKIFITISIILVAFSLASVAVFGLRIGVDFVGGSLIEIRFIDDRPGISEVNDTLEKAGLVSFSARSFGEDSVVIRTPSLTEEERALIVSALSQDAEQEVVVERLNSIGPSISSELARKSYIAIAAIVLSIILYVTFVFRGVSKPLPSWKYGAVAIVTLVHDVIIPIGVFALLGYFMGAEVDILFVTALLTIFGSSVNDTIVVFDRIRENLRLNQEKKQHEEFSQLVGRSLSQTFARSFNTSFSIILVTSALYFFGGESTRYFSLTLLIGMVVGAYSSLFLASPLLVKLQEMQKEKPEAKE